MYIIISDLIAIEIGRAYEKAEKGFKDEKLMKKAQLVL